jgi:hypothetical protein
MFPVSRTRTPAVSHHEAKEFEFIKLGWTDRSTVTNRLGGFDGYYEDLRVGYYVLNYVSEKMLWIAFPGIPVDLRSVGQGSDIAMIYFDECDRVQRVNKFMEWHPEYKLRSRAELMVGHKAK